MLKDLPQKMTRSDVKKVTNNLVTEIQVEVDNDEVDRFFSLLDDLESDEHIQS